MIYLNFDGLSFPLDKPIVVLDSDEGPIEGAGLTWTDEAVTVEIKLRGHDPLHFSLVENAPGRFGLVLPEVEIRSQIEDETSDH